ncbi:hypothetical protein Tco_1051659 [Tanacetum coccineum]
MNKEVDEAYNDELKFKLKAAKQVSLEAQLLLNLKKYAKESIKEHILKQIPKGPREGSSVVPNSPDNNNSSESSVWESSNDDKTGSDDDSNNEDNEDNSNKDSDVGEDQKEGFRILTLSLTVVPFLDTIPEVQEQVPIDQKNDSTKTIMQKLADHEQILNALSEEDHAEVIEESVKANVLNEVKNQLPKFMPKAVSDYVQPHCRIPKNLLDRISQVHKPFSLSERLKADNTDLISHLLRACLMLAQAGFLSSL